jgi:hypothetical protein
MRFYDRQMHSRLGEPSQRQHIPEQPGRQQAMGMPQMGMSQPGSQGMFSQYMSQLFNQKYAPPMMQGSPLQNYGGYFGFGAPRMSPISSPVKQTQAVGPGQTPDTNPGMTWSEYLNAGS